MWLGRKPQHESPLFPHISIEQILNFIKLPPYQKDFSIRSVVLINRIFLYLL